jgi:7-cyano-7-deazaguanine synthase
MSTKKAVILTSGGLDSTTCLAIAQNKGYECHTISFDYGQRHRSELNAAAIIAKAYGAASHKVIKMDLRAIGGSALTDNIDVPDYDPNANDIPVTYVPARNIVFLSLALGFAEVIDAHTIYIGVSSVDYSGYPDCREEFITAFAKAAALGTQCGVNGQPIEIMAPLSQLSKAQTVQLGDSLGVDYGLTVSCYQADDDGLACGSCDSCALRKKGFEEAHLQDPTRYQIAPL